MAITCPLFPLPRHRQLSVSFAGELGEVRRYDKLRVTPDLLLCLLQVGWGVIMAAAGTTNGNVNSN